MTPAPRSRFRHALLLITALLLGYAAHGWHHVVDHDCDAGPGPGAHACVGCSALHGQILLGDTNLAVAPSRPIELRLFCAPIACVVDAIDLGASAPRAPPTA